MKSRRFAMGVAVLAVLAVVAAACGGSSAGTNEALKALSGDIVADGSSTVFPITQAVAQEFERAGATAVKISVGSSGTGGGFKKFCNGETDLSDASRPIKDSEKAECAKKTIEFVELAVAIDGLSLVVNPDITFVDCLTLAELKKIWEPNSTVNNWSQVRTGFPNRPLTLYGAGTDSGTFDYFTAEINGEEGASRKTYRPSENDNELVRGVANDKNALGYFGYSYYVQNKSTLKVIGVDPGTGCVKPTTETINDGTYKPLSRPLFVYVAKSAIAKSQVKAFVDYYLDTVSSLLPSVGYIELHADDLAKSKAAWAAAAA